MSSVTTITVDTRRPRAVPATPLIRGAFWILIATALIPTNSDPDLWGNLRFGFDLLASHRLSTVDPYSFTQDLPWINHEWLAQGLMALAYRLGGPAGLVTLKAVVGGATLWLIAGAFKNAPLVAEMAAGFVLWAALPVTLTCRAQIWTFFGVALLCRVLYGRASTARYAVPLIFAIWVNCHVGWVIGLAILCLWAAGVFVRRDDAGRRNALVIVALTLLATLVNPYGWQMWSFLVRTSHLSRNLQEWQPLWTSPVVNWVPWSLAATLVAFGIYKRWLSIEQTVCLAGLAYASVRVLKFSNVFVEVAILFLAPAISRTFSRSAWAVVPRLETGVRVLNTCALAVLVGTAGWLSRPFFRCIPSGDWRPDPIAAQALLEARPTGRMAVYFDWGEYVIWHFGPQLMVSFDPRFDLIYSPAVIKQQNAIDSADPVGIDFLDRARPEYVWFPASSTNLKTWLAVHGYRIDVDTARSFLAVRTDLPAIKTSAQPVAGCFPTG